MNFRFLCHSSMLHSLPSVNFTWRELNKESPKMGDWTHYYRQQKVWQHFHASKNPDMAGLIHTLRYFLHQAYEVNTYGSSLVNISSIPRVWSPKTLNKFHGIDNEHTTTDEFKCCLCLSNITLLLYLKLKWTLVSDYIKINA